MSEQFFFPAIGVGVIGLVVLIAVGLLGLKLLSMLVNGMVGHRRPHQMAERGSVSRGTAGLLAGFSLLAVLLGAVLLFFVRSGVSRTSVARQSRQEAEIQLQHAIASAQAQAHELAEQGHVESRDISNLRNALQNVVQDAVSAIPDAARSEVHTADGDSAATINISTENGGTRVSIESTTTGAAIESTSASAQESAPPTGDEHGTPDEPVTPATEDTAALATGFATSTTDEPAAAASSDNSAETVAATVPIESAVPAETPVAEQPPAAAEATPPVTDAQTSDSSGAESNKPSTTNPASAQMPMDPARKQQLSQIATLLGQIVNSQLAQRQDPRLSAGPDGIPGTEDDVVVFQVSQEMVGEIIGESGRELLKSFNDELPESIRQSYALIPLSPPVGSAVTPASPLIPDGSLNALASSIISLVKIADPAAQPVGNSSVVLATAPELTPMPHWVNGSPGGRRLRAESEAVFSSEDDSKSLTDAINVELQKHLATITDSSNSAIRNQLKFTTLTLVPETAKSCVVEQWTRFETVDSAVEGSKSFHKIYALVQFPEEVDAAALRALRKSAQIRRITEVGSVLGLTWLGVVLAGGGIRLWRRGGVVRKAASASLIGLLAIPFLVIAGGVAIALAVGESPVRAPWIDQPAAVQIDLGQV